MGWKAIKDHYRIGHYVCVTKEGICIGSGYIHDIIIIGLDGKVKKRYADGRTNDDLLRYQSEFDANPELLAELVKTPDTFSAAHPVYTYSGGEIVEKFCEEYKWPNVTHDGAVMYKNTFSKDKAEVVGWAKRNAEYGIEGFARRVKEIKEKLAEIESLLITEKQNRAKLETDYPEIPSAPRH